MKLLYQKLFERSRICVLFLCFFLVSTCGFSQQGSTFRGTVVDSAGAPMIGASVTVKSTKKGVFTDKDGSFTIQAAPGTVVVVSNVGFNSKEFTLSGSGPLSFRLTDANSSLSDVVVVGYGTQKKATISGAISNIKADDIIRTPAVGATSALVGKIQGITARAADARPGNGTTIQIRNLGTPLYVIDGVPYSVPDPVSAFGLTTGLSGQDVFNSLGLEDIESVTILKDAAASIYGLRASNGVVLVTTKKRQERRQRFHQSVGLLRDAELYPVYQARQCRPVCIGAFAV